MTKQYNLSMTPGDVDVIVPVSQLDDGIRTIVFNLVNGSGDSGEFTMPDHAVVTIEAIKPDKKVVSYSTIESPEIISVVGSIVTVIPPQQLTAVAGNVFAKIKITDPDNVRESNSIESSRIVFAVDACPLGADPDTSESSLGPVVALVQEAQGYATTAAESAADVAGAVTEAQNYATAAQGYADAAAEGAAEAAVEVVTVTGPSINAETGKRYIFNGSASDLTIVLGDADKIFDLIVTAASSGLILWIDGLGETLSFPPGLTVTEEEGIYNVTLPGGYTYEINVMSGLVLMEAWT